MNKTKNLKREEIYIINTLTTMMEVWVSSISMNAFAKVTGSVSCIVTFTVVSHACIIGKILLSLLTCLVPYCPIQQDRKLLLFQLEVFQLEVCA
jgi:hypothetical protein